MNADHTGMLELKRKTQVTTVLLRRRSQVPPNHNRQVNKIVRQCLNFAAPLASCLQQPRAVQAIAISTECSTPRPVQLRRLASASQVLHVHLAVAQPRAAVGANELPKESAVADAHDDLVRLSVQQLPELAHALLHQINIKLARAALKLACSSPVCSSS